MSAKKTPKNQHYVPKFLLRQFAFGSGERVYAWDKTKRASFVTAIRNTGSENGFYDLTTAVDGQKVSLDPLMDLTDNRGAAIVQSILRHQSVLQLTCEERRDLALFAATQFVRVKAARDKLGAINEALRSAIKSRNIDPGDVLPEMTPADVKAVSLAKISDARAYAKLFHEKLLLLHEAPDGSHFVTSDNPVALDNQVPGRGFGNLGLKSVGVEIYLPLSPRFSLCFLCKSHYVLAKVNLGIVAEELAAGRSCPLDTMPLREFVDAVESGKPEQLTAANVIHQNSLQMINASRFIYAQSNDFSLMEEMAKSNANFCRPPQVTVM